MTPQRQVMCIVGIFLIFLGGCYQPSPEYWKDLNNGHRGTWLSEVTLSDGTRCAVLLDALWDSAIDCDWQRQSEKEK